MDKIEDETRKKIGRCVCGMLIDPEGAELCYNESGHVRIGMDSQGEPEQQPCGPITWYFPEAQAEPSDDRPYKEISDLDKAYVALEAERARSEELREALDDAWNLVRWFIAHLGSTLAKLGDKTTHEHFDKLFLEYNQREETIKARAALSAHSQGEDKS